MKRKLGISTQSMAVTAALRLEAEPSVPCPDIEHAPSGKVRRNGKAVPAGAQDLERVMPFEARPVRQFEAVVPALRRQFLAEILPALGLACGGHETNCRIARKANPRPPRP